MMQRPSLVNISQQSLKTCQVSRREFNMRFILHLISSEDFPRTYGTEPRIGKLVERQCEVPEPHRPLRPPMSILTQNGNRSTKIQTLHLFLLLSMSVAINFLPHTLEPSRNDVWLFSCSHQLTILLHLVSHLSDLINRQNHGSAPRFFSHTIRTTLRNLGTVLGATRNPVL